MKPLLKWNDSNKTLDSLFGVMDQCSKNGDGGWSANEDNQRTNFQREKDL